MAERRATELRTSMGLKTDSRLDIREAAQHLNVLVRSAGDLVSIGRLEELERIQAYAFSAATFDIRGRNVIVTNPLNSQARQNSDVAHELAHIMLEHDLTEIRSIGETAFRTCTPSQEEEATTLGSTILLPRPLLMKAARRGATPDAIAAEFEVTDSMARYRYNSTGVAKQVG